MKRTALIVCGAVLVVISLVTIYIRDFTSLALHFPHGGGLRLLAAAIVWGALLGGASLLAAGWLKKPDVPLDK